MLTTSVQFNGIARTIAERLADLLSAYVYVIDDTGVPIASSEPEGVRLPLEVARQEPGAYFLRIPLRFNGTAGEVVVTAPDNGEALSPRTAQMLVELMINQMMATAHLHDRYELKSKFIYDLLHESLTDEADISREGEILGMDFTRTRAVLLIEADYVASLSTSRSRETREERIQRRAQLVITSVVRFFRLPSDAICAYIGEGQIAVLKASSTQDLAPWVQSPQTDPDDKVSGLNGSRKGRAGGLERNDALSRPSWANLTALKNASGALLAQLQRDTNAPVSIGVGRYHPGILGLAASYRDARAALSLGRLFQGHNRVHCLDEVKSAAFVGISDRDTKADLAKHMLSPLEQEPELIETVKVFLEENCSPSAAAIRLSVHRNTLLYRLNKVRLLTGLDPHSFQDAVQIYLALLAVALD
ncbi:MAG: PucR family transcriptional regulator [Chloroflexia bacterium]